MIEPMLTTSSPLYLPTSTMLVNLALHVKRNFHIMLEILSSAIGTAMGIRENIIALRTQYQITQEELAAIAGVSRGAVSQWEGGFSEPRMGAIERMAEHFKLRKSDFIEEGGMYRQQHSDDYTEVPLLGRIAAGMPMEMMEVENSFPIPSAVYDLYPRAFLLTVDGESMNRILPNGSYALVDPCETVELDGKPYAVCVNGYDATIKRVRCLSNGFELVPDSTDPTYHAAVYDYGIEGTETITIIGRVVWYCVPFDWEF